MSKKMAFPLKHYGESEVQVVPSEMMFGRANPIQGWLGGFEFVKSTLFPVACRGVTEQREELEKPWCLKANHISSEYPVRLRRGSFIQLFRAQPPFLG